MTSTQGPRWGKGHHPLWKRLRLLSSPLWSLSKAFSSRLASSFYTVLWRFFNPPGGYKLYTKGDAGCQLSSSSTSLISCFSLLAFSFTQKGKLWKENNTWVWVCVQQNGQIPSGDQTRHPPKQEGPQFRRLAMKQTTMLVLQHFPLPQTQLSFLPFSAQRPDPCNLHHLDPTICP